MCVCATGGSEAALLLHAGRCLQLACAQLPTRCCARVQEEIAGDVSKGAVHDEL